MRKQHDDRYREATRAVGGMDLLTRGQLAAELGISKRTLDQLVRARTIPIVRLTRRSVRFRRIAVEAALARIEEPAR